METDINQPPPVISEEDQQKINLINTLGELLYTINVDIVKAREIYKEIINPKQNINHE